MARPYSQDLRERVVAAVTKEGQSKASVGRRFGVSAGTVGNWICQHREMGSVLPGQMGGYRRQTIRGEQAEWLAQRVQEEDFTLRGLVKKLAGRGLKADYSVVWKVVHGQKLT
jgi:putative transposase